ncbi:MAG TPA: 30S ribosomal protein S2 [Flavobacteriales bacterium]|nr:30S ribosomal protein S2 [Flavobacteriales bacterium]
MAKTTHKELLDAGVHFGHMKRKRNPNMAPYIFMEKNGIHIIDLNKSLVKLESAKAALRQIAKSGRKILFVATKKQAKDIVADLVKQTGMPFATERWPGGMLTNFHTIRKAVKKMSTIDRMGTDGTMENMSKKEKLQITRQRAKLERNLGSIADLTRLPAAIFIVDVQREKIAVSEAKKLNIQTFAMVDTNSDPNDVDFAIPSNDDSSKSISLIVGDIVDAIKEGLEERKKEKTTNSDEEKSKEIEEEVQSAVDKNENVAEEVEKGNEKNPKKPVKKAAKRKRIGAKVTNKEVAKKEPSAKEKSSKKEEKATA